jgi:hypothetical protein
MGYSSLEMRNKQNITVSENKRAASKGLSCCYCEEKRRSNPVLSGISGLLYFIRNDDRRIMSPVRDGMSVENKSFARKNPVRDDTRMPSCPHVIRCYRHVIPDGIPYRMRNIFYRHSVPDGTHNPAITKGVLPPTKFCNSLKNKYPTFSSVSFFCSSEIKIRNDDRRIMSPVRDGMSVENNFHGFTACRRYATCKEKYTFRTCGTKRTMIRLFLPTFCAYGTTFPPVETDFNRRLSTADPTFSSVSFVCSPEIKTRNDDCVRLLGYSFFDLY